MGSLFGAMLHRAGHAVILVDVWEEHVRAVQRGGLLVERDGGRETIPVAACLPGALEVAPEWILLFTKTFHTASALAGVQPWLNAQTHILTLQNGIGQVGVIERFIDRSRILHGITTVPCDMVGPGHIRTGGVGYIKIMSVDGRDGELLRRMGRMLAEAGFDCAVTPETTAAIWEKLAFNAAMNAMTALLRLRVGQVGDAPDGRRLAETIVDEVVSVARRKGIAAQRERILATLAMAFREHRDHQPSMLQDILARRRTEIDFINGAVVEEARALEIAVPVNETLYRLVKTLERAGLPP